MKRHTAAGLLTLLVSPTAAQNFLGSEFQVNTYTTGDQERPAVTVAPEGYFVVVWESESSVADVDRSVQLQRFLADGGKLSTEVQANSYVTGNQRRPTVGVLSGGDIATTWESEGSDGDDDALTSIQGWHYNPSFPLVAEAQVNSYTTAWQRLPSIAAQSNGFVVVWQSGIGLSYAIKGRLLTALASTSGPEFQVNSYVTGFQRSASVAAASDGDFVVVWANAGNNSVPGPDGDGASIRGRRFDSAGSPLGAEFGINTYTTGSQVAPSVAASPAGEFLVVWSSSGSALGDADGSIQARSLSSTGLPVGDEFQVNTLTTGLQRLPAVAASGTGEFLVVWISQGIVAGRFLPPLVPPEPEFRVDTLAGGPVYPAVAGFQSGEFVVVWETGAVAGTEMGGDTGIRGRLLHSAIFTDGFETGDTIAWSSSQGGV